MPMTTLRSRDGRSVLARSFGKFVVAGGVSVCLDIALLYVLHSVLHLALAAAVITAYAPSLVVNYSLNHAWVFEAEGDLHRRLVRYLILLGINIGSTLLIVDGLDRLGVYYLLAKVLAVGVNAMLNFTAYRLWVFR
jgi:putative flippase GtrA